LLRTLRIRQLVIVEDLTVEFGPGLNLLTGETGAGKSILVDALGLVTGARADRALVRAGAERAIVEALFDLDEADSLRAWAAEVGLQEAVEERRLVVRRELPASGSGRILLNGSPCTRAMLREVCGRLLAIHGQHEQHSLLSPERQLALLDEFGGHRPLLEEVARAHAAVLAARERHAELLATRAERGERCERLEETIREIEAVAPRSGERDALDRERALLRNAARVGELLDELVARCYDGEGDAASQAAAAARRAAELAALDPTLDEPAGRLDSLAVELQEIGAIFRDYRDRTDFDPERLDELEERRVQLERLCLRHGADEEKVLARCEEARRELAVLERVADDLARSEREISEAEQSYVTCARRLGKSRRAASGRLSRAVEAELAHLALEKARLRVELSPVRGDAQVGEGAASVPLGPRGAERAELQLAANPGEPFRPLSRVASGGELSRVMLALHGVVRDVLEHRALVFDEVDAGVGGAVADAVGARLAGLAGRRQVLCVTHLPQVAAYADRHYLVRKEIRGERTQASVADLRPADRVEELARMLGGRRPTTTSRRHASELLTAAGRSARG
jgi:DNA repair protein RecN (Recombination protein N)